MTDPKWLFFLLKQPLVTNMVERLLRDAVVHAFWILHCRHVSIVGIGYSRAKVLRILHVFREPKAFGFWQSQGKDARHERQHSENYHGHNWVHLALVRKKQQ